MVELLLIGIGAGNPDHLTREGEAAIRSADCILIPRKGAEKDDLAALRRQICADVLGPEAASRIHEFDLPVRDAAGDYRRGVDAWHDRIAESWTAAIEAAGSPARVALLIWGDPSLYDSSLRIAGRLRPKPAIRVVPGITALQALTAAHGVPLNEIGAPVMITTGRRLTEDGWPAGADTVAVMLDGRCSFQSLTAPCRIWWGAYLGMANELIITGQLPEVGDEIVKRRAAARTVHGWIMDIYLLRRG